jgi:hypothetical protein
MTVISSATRTLSRSSETLYVTSEEWGQPPASHQVIEIQANQDTGEQPQNESVYVAIGPVQPVVDPELEAEFAAWDRASDEALFNFEAGLG